MPAEKSFIAVENLIADHVAISFKQDETFSKADGTAAQIRRRITDRFQAPRAGSEQDNSPPAVQALYNRLFSAFSIVQPAGSSDDRLPQLTLLHKTLRALSQETRSSTRKDMRPAHIDLLLERQQLVLKNEYTLGFGRIEIWLVSLAALFLVMLSAIDFLWSLPALGLSVGRSWHLDRQCKKRCARIAEIDAIVEPAGQRSYS
ncbi:hypothetical protein [Microvirga sp. TS319]|uniref:hypothetical protein n=1 Tax=Microvirga sp. TS319 TaxID=3241165 RepID=UPI00351A6D65